MIEQGRESGTGAKRKNEVIQEMSAADVKEIVYHCECRRFVQGTPTGTCFCHECGREHSLSDTQGRARHGRGMV
jgi:hypothetical protein